MRLKVRNKDINLWLVLFLLCICGDVLSRNIYKREVRAEYPKGCIYLKCKRGDQCVNRKFWCKNPPCPSMLYCSKSRKESLKGPTSCEAVQCSKGFICLVRVRHCRWGQPCEQQMARCVSEREYYEGPATCLNFSCPDGLGCILRESLCVEPPCKLVRSCANTKDVMSWYEGCKFLGCLSEYECFLRRPADNCKSSPCQHTPDCSAKSEEELEAYEHCRGWVCPKGEECSVHTRGLCKRDISCRTSRSCHGPSIAPLNLTLEAKDSEREKWKPRLYSMIDKNSAKIDITSGQVVQPIVASLSNWPDHLSLITGEEAIAAWIDKAEQPEYYGAFLEWLVSIKDMLGPAVYNQWLEEIRTMTVTNLAFQKWLPPVGAGKPLVSIDSVKPGTNTDDATSPVLGIPNNLLKSIKYPNKKVTGKPFISIDSVEPDTNTDDATSPVLGIPNNLLKSIKYPKNKVTGKPLISIDSVEPDTNTDNATTPVLGIPNNLLKSIKYPNNKDNYYTHQGTANNMVPMTGMMTSDLENTREKTTSTLPMISTLPPSMPINEWQQFWLQNAGNFVPWSIQAPQFPKFVTTHPMNLWYLLLQHPTGVIPHLSNTNTWQGLIPSLVYPQRNQVSTDRPFLESSKVLGQQLATNWSFQQPLFTSSQSQPSNAKEGQYGTTLNPLQQEKSEKPKFQEITKLLKKKQSQTTWSYGKHPETEHFSGGTHRRSNEQPLKVRSDNSTNKDALLLKYFMDQMSRQKVPPKKFGTFPIAVENVGYESWPGSNYQGQSLADVPNSRTNHPNATRYADHRHSGRAGQAGRSGETTPKVLEGAGFSPEYPWLKYPRHQNVYRQDQHRRNLNEKNNREGPPALHNLSRTHSVNAGPRSSSQNPIVEDIHTPPVDYHWPSTYLNDQLYNIVGLWPMTSYIVLQPPAITDGEYDGRFVPLTEPNQSGQPSGLSGPPNSKFKGQQSSIFPNHDREFSNNQDANKQKHLIGTTISPPSVSQQVVPERSEHSHGVGDCNHQEGTKRFEYYDEDYDIFPLVLSLQGYIEPSKEDKTGHRSISSENSTILPVYKVEDDSDRDEEYSTYYESSPDGPTNLSSSSDGKAVNIFVNAKYERSTDFLHNPKSVSNTKTAVIIKNMTGENDVEIKDIKWDYEDDEGYTIDSFTPIHGFSSTNQTNDWTGSTSGLRNEGGAGNYYDEGVDYKDESIPGDKSNYNFRRVNTGASFNRKEVPEDLVDSFHNDPYHKRFKKNRP